MDGSGLGANDWTEMELKKRAYPVVTLDSAALQGRIAVDDLAIRLQSLGAPDRSRWCGHRERRAARGGLARAVYIYAARSPV